MRKYPSRGLVPGAWCMALGVGVSSETCLLVKMLDSNVHCICVNRDNSKACPFHGATGASVCQCISEPRTLVTLSDNRC